MIQKTNFYQNDSKDKFLSIKNHRHNNRTA